MNISTLNYYIRVPGECLPLCSILGIYRCKKI